jgi:hypothetical protein
MLGPLKLMQIGDTISRSNTYTLKRRTVADPDQEARNWLLPQ